MINTIGEMAVVALSLPRSVKRFMAVATDVFLCCFSVYVSFALILNRIPDFYDFALVEFFAFSVFLSIPIFVRFGFYRAIFRYSGLPAVKAVASAFVIYFCLFSTLAFFIDTDGVPKTICVLQPIFLFVLVGAVRALAKIWLGGLYQKHFSRSGQFRVLIYGAGSAGRKYAQAMRNSHEVNIVGFLDDDPALQGHFLHGLPIYDPKNLKNILDHIDVTDVLLALPSVSRQRRNEIIDSLRASRLAVRSIPGLSDLATGKINFNEIAELDIDDLLGREPVRPNLDLLNKNTHRKRVLVTGAGGSIGSELCRQIIATQPSVLLLVEMSEFALYKIHHELSNQLIVAQSDSLGVEIIPLLASVCDQKRMADIMNSFRPDTVYHAAAYKHVPLVEHNPGEGIWNNVWGTYVCAQTSAASEVKNFVLVSTDKAVRPTNIMGASKRLAEMVLQALADDQKLQVGGMRTCFSMVRFGNVLGSSGSVVPLFRDQIKKGGPVTLTHPEINRYFMTIPEAAQLVIQAGAMGEGGDVFVLDMGQPVRIYDLARKMIELSGFTVREEGLSQGGVEIKITGLRPGEKLYEELLIGDNPRPTIHPRIMVAHEDFILWKNLQLQLHSLDHAIDANDVEEIRRLLQILVHGFKPDEEIVDFVFKARSHHLV